MDILPQVMASRYMHVLAEGEGDQSLIGRTDGSFGKYSTICRCVKLPYLIWACRVLHEYPSRQCRSIWNLTELLAVFLIITILLRQCQCRKS